MKTFPEISVQGNVPAALAGSSEQKPVAMPEWLSIELQDAIIEAINFSAANKDWDALNHWRYIEGEFKGWLFPITEPADDKLREVFGELVAKLHRICNHADEFGTGNISTNIVRSCLGEAKA